jgi:Na+/H+ antiporter NhaA
MKINKFYYFKRAFILSIPISVFVIVRAGFGIELTDISEIMKIVIKGISVGIITGIVLGIINIFAKTETLMKTKKNE